MLPVEPNMQILFFIILKNVCSNENRPARGLVKQVNYIGLEDNPFHELAVKQFGETAGAMLTIDLADRKACFSFIDHLQLIRRATNLFDNKSLAIHPYSTIFGPFSGKQKAEMDVRDTTIRLSVGLEDVDDIFEDIVQAVRAIP